MEGPWIIWWNNFYYMFYSSGGFSDPRYHLACARSASLSGPYEKSPSPVVSVDMARYKMLVNCTWEGPGHGSAVQDGDGRWWMVYHAWTYQGVGRNPPGREMLLDRLVMDRDGWPSVRGRVPSDMPRMGPGGTDRGEGGGWD